MVTDLSVGGLHVRATLTDWFPNVSALEHIAAGSNGQITFVAEPVDARSVPAGLSGFRTIFNGFHHFRPSDAIAVLRNATTAGQSIAIFEISERSIGTLLGLFLLTPLLVAIATPFIRPFRWSRLFYTYLLPLVPLTCWWDGIVSQCRAYTPNDLEALGVAADPSASWRAGRVPLGSVPSHLTYLIGYSQRLKAER
jgi:hypothetical protein